jgi:hypothetical protein
VAQYPPLLPLAPPPAPDPPPLDTLPDDEPAPDEPAPDEHVPDWHVPPTVVQSAQSAPPVPQNVSAWVVWHVPVLSQQPVQL